MKEVMLSQQGENSPFRKIVTLLKLPDFVSFRFVSFRFVSQNSISPIVEPSMVSRFTGF